MNRLAPLDRVLLLTVLPLWVVCFAFAVRTQIDGGGVAGLGLQLEAPGAYPVLTGDFQRAVHTRDPLEAAGLRAGDRLIHMGNADLRGVGTLGFTARSYAEGKQGTDVPVVYERGGERREALLTMAPLSVYLPTLAASFAFVASAVFLLLRGQPTPTVRAQFHAGMAWGFANCTFPSGPLSLYAWLGLWVTAGALVHGLSIRFLFRFPDDRPPAGRWHAVWPWFFAAPAGTPHRCSIISG